MTLDCPGCRSRLKIDPAKLPAGATTAVCPKCKTRILLPKAAAAGELTVQCRSCSARLKVSVAKLKPTVTRSTCPKCGQPVELPAAPPEASRPAVERQAAAHRAPAPQQAPHQEAMTRRLDARELGMLLGTGPGREGGGSPAASAAPIQLGEPMEQSADDLSQLIDERVDALEDTGPTRAQASRVAPPASRPPAPPAGRPAAPPSPGAERLQEEAAQREAPSDAAVRRSGPGRSSSGSRPTPEFGSIAAGSGKPPSSASLLMVGGGISGSLVGAALLFLGSSLPDGLRPSAPEALGQALGAGLATLLLTMVLSALGGLLGSVALPPQGESAGVSVFRCTVATTLLGLLAGVLFSLLSGPFQIKAVAGWTGALALAGILTGILGSILRRK